MYAEVVRQALDSIASKKEADRILSEAIALSHFDAVPDKIGDVKYFVKGPLYTIVAETLGEDFADTLMLWLRPLLMAKVPEPSQPPVPDEIAGAVVQPSSMAPEGTNAPGRNDSSSRGMVVAQKRRAISFNWNIRRVFPSAGSGASGSVCHSIPGFLDDHGRASGNSTSIRPSESDSRSYQHPSRPRLSQSMTFSVANGRPFVPQAHMVASTILGRCTRSWNRIKGSGSISTGFRSPSSRT